MVFSQGGIAASDQVIGLQVAAEILARDGAIQFDGKEFRALEPLFLHLTGERYADLNWL